MQTSLSDRKKICLRDRALSRNLRPVPSATETPANTVAAHDPCYGATGLAIQHRAPRHEGEFPALLDKRKPPAGKIHATQQPPFDRTPCSRLNQGLEIRRASCRERVCPYV